MQNFNDVIGLTIEEAKEKLKGCGINSIRPLMIDGEHMMGTMDYRLDRLNVSIANGLITSINKIG